jgi:hypothetical protein
MPKTIEIINLFGITRPSLLVAVGGVNFASPKADERSIKNHRHNSKAKKDFD